VEKTMSILAGLAAATLPVPEAPPTYGPEWTEVAPDVWSTDPAPPIKPPSPKDRQCVKTWRAINYAAHAADVASSLAAIDRGGIEGNPLIRAAFGKRPKVHEFLSFKAAGIGLFEFMTRNASPRDKCTALKINSALTFTVAGANLRFLF
jgi:hypothetical protein